MQSLYTISHFALVTAVEYRYTEQLHWNTCWLCTKEKKILMVSPHGQKIGKEFYLDFLLLSEQLQMSPFSLCIPMVIMIADILCKGLCYTMMLLTFPGTYITKLHSRMSQRMQIHVRLSFSWMQRGILSISSFMIQSSKNSFLNFLAFGGGEEEREDKSIHLKI